MISKKNARDQRNSRLNDKNNNWFYCDENSVCLSEQKEDFKDDLNDNTESKNKSRVNSYNSEEKKGNYKVEVKQLIDDYTEETILLLIPQDDTKIEDVLKKFKDHTKVINTIKTLKERGKVIAGQGYIRSCTSRKKIDNYDEETVLQMVPEENIVIKEFVAQFADPNKVVDTLCILEKKGNIAASQGVMRKIITAETRSDPPGPHLNTWTCSMCGIKFKAQIPYEDHDGHAVCEKLISEEHS